MTMPTAETSTALDEAFERMAASGFELPNGFVNHGAMACEALAALGFETELRAWAERFARSAGPEVRAETSTSFEWRDALGDYRRLPEWIGHFEMAIADDGWPSVVEVWVPRLLPGLATALFHGAIRTGHAARAIAATDTAARREELARALGYWAARYRSGEVAGSPPEVDDIRMAIVYAAAGGAHHYLARPNIFNLHGVTGAMAVDLLAPHLPAPAQAAGLAQILAEHAALYAGTGQEPTPATVAVPDSELANAAEASRDPHQVKLVEACRRGFELTGDPVFAAAAQVVTGLS
jgi:Questin oxidase-like